MFEETKLQKKLRGQPALFWVGRHMSVWSNVLFNLAVIINLIVAFFYPFDGEPPDPGQHVSGLLWTFMLMSAAVGRRFVQTSRNPNTRHDAHRPAHLLGRTSTNSNSSGLFGRFTEGCAHIEYSGQCWNVPAQRPANLHRHGDGLPRRLPDVLLPGPRHPPLLFLRSDTLISKKNYI